MTQGTKEWADSNVNIAYGCKHNCRYCYAKGMAKRFRKEDYRTWHIMRPNQTAILKNYKKRKGRIMFPTSHDIVKECMMTAGIVLQKMLMAGNEVLITTKPSLTVVRYLCTLLKDYKEQVQWRMTITSLFAGTSLDWEPGAPLPETRIAALQLARDHGYKTSVSIEPFLDQIEQVPSLVIEVQPYVTETIWIGPMNKSFCPAGDWDEDKWGTRALLRLHSLLRSAGPIEDSKLRYKDSFRKALDEDAPSFIFEEESK